MSELKALTEIASELTYIRTHRLALVQNTDDWLVAKLGLLIDSVIILAAGNTDEGATPKACEASDQETCASGHTDDRTIVLILAVEGNRDALGSAINDITSAIYNSDLEVRVGYADKLETAYDDYIASIEALEDAFENETVDATPQPQPDSDAPQPEPVNDLQVLALITRVLNLYSKNIHHKAATHPHMVVRESLYALEQAFEEAAKTINEATSIVLNGGR